MARLGQLSHARYLSDRDSGSVADAIVLFDWLKRTTSAQFHPIIHAMKQARLDRRSADAAKDMGCVGSAPVRRPGGTLVEAEQRN